MKASKGKNQKNRTANRITDKTGNRRKQLLPALMAVGGACGMMATPASALELGEIRINSSLGQPLRASIAYALNPREELYDFCVYLRPGLAANGLPALSRASVSIADGMILLTGSRPIREPLLTMQVSIDCPYTAHIAREYTLMVNPPTPVIREGPIVVEPPETADSEPVTAPAQAPAITVSPAATLAAAAPKPRPPVPSRTDSDRMPIQESSRYLVQRGDSLSDIASRISDRSIPLWPAVDRIFAANPDAFMDGDMNRLKAGSWLEIPDLSVDAPMPVVAETEAAVEITPVIESADVSAYTGYEAPAEVEEPTITESDASTPTVTQQIESDEAVVAEFEDVQPDDVSVDHDTSFVAPIVADVDETSSIDIPDIEIIEPELQPVPVVRTGQDDETAGETSGSWSWFVGLGGTGVALILGLLLFGQTFRRRFGSVAVGADSMPRRDRRGTDVGVPVEHAEEEVPFEDLEASPQSASIMLDADFDDGSGLQDSADMDVAQDFGFSASTTFDEELDMVIPEGAEAEEEDDGTEMIPPMVRQEASILESEVLPNDEDEYDMSVIVDVTKQDVVEPDATAKDLQAVQVEAGTGEQNPRDLTLTQDADYKILEQDYEDEFTATQALNAEIEKAAAELADRMDAEATGEVITGLPENTSAVNDDINDTSVTEEVTAEIPGVDDEDTADLSRSDEEITVGLEIDSDEVETAPKKKAS